MARRQIPDPVILPIQTVESRDLIRPVPTDWQDLRQQQIQEFLQTRALSPKSRKAYQQDLQRFLDWTEMAWAEVTPDQIVQFKRYLCRNSVETHQRVLSDATVRRILGTLKNFYAWMVQSRYVSFDPTAQVDLPKLTQPEPQALQAVEVEQIYACASRSRLSERNVALIAVLLQGLRVESVSALTLTDYDGGRLQIRDRQANLQGFVPLVDSAKTALELYLKWRQAGGEVLKPESPLFISHSRRNAGARLGYDGIRKVIDAISEETGIDFHAHQFRHTFANNLLQKGMNLSYVVALTRHRSVQSLQRYTKAADQSAAAAAFHQIVESDVDQPTQQ